MALLNQPRISIIMGIYNCQDTLSEAINSIISQTYTNWELIMCDDCSSDNTLNIALQYAEKYQNIHVLQNSLNKGLADTLNTCIKYAHGEYIARMDGDDISLPERFQLQVDFLDKHPEYSMVSGQMINFDENGDWGIQSNPEKPEIKDFIYRSPFCHAPIMMRAKDLKAVGNYTVRKELRRGQDYYLWHKFYKAGFKGYNFQFPIYKMRDDKNAAKRRTIKSAWYSTKMQYEIFNNLKISKIYYFRPLRHFFVALLPKYIYIKLHKIAIKRRSSQ